MKSLAKALLDSRREAARVGPNDLQSIALKLVDDAVRERSLPDQQSSDRSRWLAQNQSAQMVCWRDIGTHSASSRNSAISGRTIKIERYRLKFVLRPKE